LGKKFWDKVYSQAQKQYGTTNILVNTFNKVWILPDDAIIYEKGNTAYVLKDHLKVMLEEDYLSLKKHTGIQSTPVNKTHNIASKIVKEIILPELEKEVNEGKNFAPLRQIYSGMVLAAWYKRAIRESLLSKIYANKAKVNGIDQDPKLNEAIYRQYLQAYKKGVFNFIKEDVDKYTNESIPRKYFSGGAVDFAQASNTLGYDPLAIRVTDSAMLDADLIGDLRSRKYDYAEVAEKVVQTSNRAATLVQGGDYAQLVGDVLAQRAEHFKEVRARIFETLNQLADEDQHYKLYIEVMNEIPELNFNGLLAEILKIMTNELQPRKGEPQDKALERISKQRRGLMGILRGIKIRLSGTPDENAWSRIDYWIKLVHMQNKPGYVYNGIAEGLIPEDNFYFGMGLSPGIHDVIENATEYARRNGRPKAIFTFDSDYKMYILGFNMQGLKRAAKGELRTSPDFVRDVTKIHRELVRNLPLALKAATEVKLRPEEDAMELSLSERGLEFRYWQDIYNILESQEKEVDVLKRNFPAYFNSEDKPAERMRRVVTAYVNEVGTLLDGNQPIKELRLEIIKAIKKAKKSLRVLGKNPFEGMESFPDKVRQLDLKPGDRITVDYTSPNFFSDDRPVNAASGEVISVSSLSDGRGKIIVNINGQNEELYFGNFFYMKENNLNDVEKNTADSAELTPGGIDLNAGHLHLQIRRDGKGVPLPISQKDLENIHIDGLIPEILRIKPSIETPLISELQSAQTP